MRFLFTALCLMVTFGIGSAGAQGFKISGTQLLDANGKNFIMKGVSVPLSWFVSDVNNNIANIKNKTGSNCFRIVVNTSTADNSWQTCVNNCIANKIVPMVELHDVTGSNNSSDLQRMAQWWAGKASFLTGTNVARYILINIANEWGDWYMASPTNDPPQTAWRDAYIQAVQTLRSAGINTTLVVDAPGYGQDNKGSTLINYAAAVQAADPKKNVLFSVHMYCEWKVNGNSSISTHLPAIKNAGVPVIVGEFGYQHTEGSSVCDIDEVLIMSTCQANSIGWLAWSWKGNGSPVQYLDLSSDWAGNNLSSWGSTIVNNANGTKTAQTCTAFNGVGAIPGSRSLVEKSKEFTIQSKNNGLRISYDGFSGSTICKVFDMRGQLVERQTARDQQSEVMPFYLSPGMYIVMVSDAQKSFANRILVK